MATPTLYVVYICNRCGQEATPSGVPGFWNGYWYCSTVCMHAAGDRSVCWKGCGCTGYAKKRRLLRKHRACMRVMDDLIVEEGLAPDLDGRMIRYTGDTNFILDDHSDMDEESDKEDPEATAKKQLTAARRDLTDRSSFVEAAAGVLRQQQVQRDMERARMTLEDFRSMQLR